MNFLLASPSLPDLPGFSALLPALILGAVLIGVSLQIYARLFGRVSSGEGKVYVEPLGLPDLLVVIVLASWFGGLAVHGFLQASDPRPMTNADIVQSAVLFGILVGGITFFLTYRNISVVKLFGFRNLSGWRVLGTAAGLLLAAYPLIMVCGVLMQWALGEDAEPQEIVQFFKGAAERSDHWRVIATASVAIFVAPLAEEFLFRGYIYGTLRRYLGVMPALVMNAALFAAIHLNVTALPALFILAMCLTVAYEITGSLLVPMAMHALFNAVMLGGIYWVAKSQ